MVEELKAKANLNFNLYSRKNFYDKKLKEVLDK